MTAPHPRGLTSNPEWDIVRDRWNERYCAKVMAEAQPVSRPAPRSAIIAGQVFRIGGPFVALGLLIALFWVGLSPS